LAESDGDELEENLHMLLAEELQYLEGFAKPSKYSQIAALKLDKCGKKPKRIRHWVIPAVHSTHNSGMIKPHKIRQLFTKKLKLCG
jgi:hypothetical protein